jgi:hypothetical protein
MLEVKELDNFTKEFHRNFKRPRRGGIKESTIFYLWVFSRMLIENKNFILSEKSGDDAYIKAVNFLKKKNIGDPPDFPKDMRTLKKYFNRPLFKLMVAWIEQKASLLPQLRKLGKRINAPFEETRKKMSRKIEKFEKDWKIIKKFLAILKKEKYIKKADLTRRLGINKNFREWLIEEAIGQGYIKRVENGLSWIIHSGKSINWL